eukprot:scaffold176222_cov29-Tisochrysis_lutea.AAC.9
MKFRLAAKKSREEGPPYRLRKNEARDTNAGVACRAWDRTANLCSREFQRSTKGRANGPFRPQRLEH